MMKNRCIEYFLHKLRSGSQNTRNGVLKEMTNNIHGFNSQDLMLALEFLTTINDLCLELKMFSFLAICLTNNDHHYETISTFKPLYDKIETILSRSLPLKATNVLNFVTVLVYTDDVEGSCSKRKTLALHARHTIRVSGCLGAMITLFANSMMFPDTWKALCQCLAECCRDCHINQTQCGHLIPLCVQKCLQGFSDVIVVLQTILNEHPRNVQLFLHCNGIQIFSRETVQNPTCLQLLSSLVKTPEVASLIRNTATPEHITEILHWNGPHSQRGQWCTIIMYYLDSFDKQPLKKVDEVLREKEDVNDAAEKDANVRIQTAIEDITHLGDDYYQANQGNDDTAKLFRNVVKEMLYWKSKEEKNTEIFPRAFMNSSNIKNIWVNHNMPPAYPGQPSYKANANNLKPNKMDSRYVQDEELSFSFLRDQNDDSNQSPTIYKNIFQSEKISRSRYSNLVSSNTQTDNQAVKYLSEKSVQTNFESKSAALRQLNIVDDEKSTVDSNKFKPQVMSTPKRKRYVDDHIKMASNFLPYHSRNDPKKSASSYIPTSQVRKERRRKLYKTLKKSSPVKLATRSMSARFINAINESCTNLVKTVKNVFTTEKKEDTSAKTCKAYKTAASSKYSFMNYMRKRDAILGESYIRDSRQYLEKSDNKTMIMKKESPCKTCDDTALLRQKLYNNEYLKLTVKKLKLGINLYGCDFNKISKTFWPHDTFMSPTVLYNLYRKLLLKKSFMSI